MKLINTLKNPIFYYSLVLFCFYIIFSNSLSNINIFNSKPIYSLQLNGPLLLSLDLIVLLTPYVFGSTLLLFIGYRYTHFLKRIKFMLLVKVVMIAILVLMILIIIFAYLNFNNMNLAIHHPAPNTPVTTSTNPPQTPVSVAKTHGNEYLNIFFILLAGIFLLIILGTSRSFLKKEEKPATVVTNNPEIKYKFDKFKGDIIEKYLIISNHLESKGINPDFSLTPIEFDSETKNKIKSKEFEIITYYYELARFSENPLTEEDHSKFQDNLDKLKEKIDGI